MTIGFPKKLPGFPQITGSIMLLLLVSMLSGFVVAEHQPLYLAEPHSSTITATAKAFGGELRGGPKGIRRISLTVTNGMMTDCSEDGGLPAVIPCRIEANTVQHDCFYAETPQVAECRYQLEIEDKRMISYVAEAENSDGDIRVSEEFTYAGGNFPAAPVARPVRWHRNVSMANMIDIAFFPDTDFQDDYRLFTRNLQGIIQGAFFNPDEPFAAMYYNRPINIWAAPFGADASACNRDFSNAATAPFSGPMDGRVIVHREDFSDCATIALGGAGTVSVNPGRVGNGERPEVIFVHESGHFLHGQGDEYEVGSYSVAGDCVNIFTSKEACDAAPERKILHPKNHKPAVCVRISEVEGSPGYRWWHGEGYDDGSDNPHTDIMKDVGADASLVTDCAYCVRRRFEELCLKAGSCY